jgi:hypothetical protein
VAAGKQVITRAIVRQTGVQNRGRMKEDDLYIISKFRAAARADVIEFELTKPSQAKNEAKKR